MFDLERAIAEWRRQMAVGGIRSPESLDELEVHLREEIEHRRRSGLPDEHVFGAAVAQLGGAAALQGEFNKIREASSMLDKLMIGVAATFVGFILFLGTVSLVLCYGNVGDRLIAAAAILATVLVALGWKRAVPFLPLIPSAWKRLTAGLACMGAGFSLAACSSNFILPHFEAGPDRQLPAIGTWMVFIIAVFSCTGVGLTLSARDREKLGVKLTRSQITAAKHS